MKIHQPVLLDETIELLDLQSGEVVIDMTAGYGGHSAEILKRIGTAGKLILVDRDIEAIKHLRKQFANNKNVEILHSNYANLDWDNISTVDKALLDLGVSSPQLDESSRGFSFSREAALDMRMDQSQQLSAYDIVNNSEEHELADIIYRYGEERRSRLIAKTIVESRSIKPISTTKQLADIVSGCLAQKGKTHPATRTFQAIRIAVNQELENLEAVLPKIANNLAKGGRLAVISFHSLEDRIVKQFFRGLVTAEKDSVTGSVLREPNFILVNKKPIKGSTNDKNPRARSAKLRCVEKTN